MWFRIVQVLLLATLVNELYADELPHLNDTHCVKLVKYIYLHMTANFLLNSEFSFNVGNEFQRL